MVQTSFATLPDGLQMMALFDQAFAQCISSSTKTVTGPYTLLNTDGSNTLALDGNAFYALTVNAPSTYSTNFVAIIINTDPSRGKTINISGITSFILWPLQSFILLNESGSWRLSPRAQRWARTVSTTFNVDPVLGLDTNDGLATGTGAFQTIQHAITTFLTLVDVMGNAANILLADGTYTENNVLVFGLDGALVDINLGGTTGHTAAVIWNVPAGQIAMEIKDNGCVTFSNLTINGGTGAQCISVGQLGIVDFESTVVFGNCPGGSHIGASVGASVNCLGYTITGTAYAQHIVAIGECGVTFNNQVITIAAATFQQFILAWAGASISAVSVTFTGAGSGAGSTGQKFIVQYGGSIYTGGRDPNSVFPGATKGLVQVGNSDGILSTFPSSLFSALPASPQLGIVVVITDSTTNTWGATIAGSGGDTVLAWYNGSNWTVVGK